MPDARSFLPLKPADYLLLLALVEGEQHGYALAQAIAERSGGVLRLEPGNLYRVIRRLEDDGLVAESGRRPAAELDDERRRYYKLTALGARVAAAESSRLQALLASAPVQALAPLMGGAR